MNPSDASLCPLCGNPNECQLCTAAVYKGPCWCYGVQIPAALVARVPDESRNRSCICRRCVEEFQRHEGAKLPQPLCADDFYYSAGKMVFTETYHLRRGYCCGNGCRHCPYSQLERSHRSS
jgi:hypothetical protein